MAQHRPENPVLPSSPRRAPDTPKVDGSQSLSQLRALGYSRVPSAPALVRGRPVTAVQAAMGSGVLGPLLRQARQSQDCLAQLQSVLPPALLALVESGPLENGRWTLLVAHSAAAAKIRQWVPALAAHVRSKGWAVTDIEVKVRIQ